MKVTVMADIHGRLCWNDIVEREKDSDLFIFLGDYVSTHYPEVTEEQQCSNFEDILRFKEENSDKVILLRGNHLIQHLGYWWAECSGYFRKVGKWCMEQRERILKDTQWIYLLKGETSDPIIFSHAGISKTWLKRAKVDIESVNTLKPNPLFGFYAGLDNPYDSFGDSIYQCCEWIRPNSLINDFVPGYNQVVGHTPVKHIFNIKTLDISNKPDNMVDIWLCDCLPNEYLTITNGNFEVKKVCLE